MGKPKTGQAGASVPYKSNVDCTEGAKRGLWLVKVPKYLSDNWKSLAGQGEVGRLYVGGSGNAAGSGSSPDVIFRTTKKNLGPILNSRGPPGSNEQRGASNGPQGATGSRVRGVYDPVASAAPAVMPGVSGYTKKTPDSIPDEHKFVIHGDNSNLSLAIYSEDKGDVEEGEKKSGRLSLEGRVVKRAECRPPTSLNYMKMKMEKIVDYSKPTRQIKTMEKAVIKFKPVAMHTEMVAKEKQRKEGKNVRMDRDRVLEKLFEAFERHQYYKLNDLANVTNQPPNYIKELLNEIGRYNTAPPHKFMWELKAEYRHYKADEEMTDVAGDNE